MFSRWIGREGRLGIVAAVLGACIAACAPKAEVVKEDAPAASGCAQTASQTINLLGPTPDYVVEARSFDGPMPEDGDAAAVASSNPCEGATVVLTVRRLKDGGFAHGFVNVMGRMDLISGHAGPAFRGEQIGAFLGEWVKVTVATTDAAPDPRAQTMSTPLAAAAYAAMKASKAPMLCHATSVYERACFSIDPENPYALTPFFTEDQS